MNFGLKSLCRLPRKKGQEALDWATRSYLPGLHFGDRSLINAQQLRHLSLA